MTVDRIAMQHVYSKGQRIHDLAIMHVCNYGQLGKRVLKRQSSQAMMESP